MTHAGYVATGYGLVFAMLAVYALWLVLRGRALARRFRRDDLPWT